MTQNELILKPQNTTPFTVYIYDWLGHIDDELTLAFETLKEATYYASEIEESAVGAYSVIVSDRA